MKSFFARIFGMRFIMLSITTVLGIGLLFPNFAFAQNTVANSPANNSNSIMDAISAQVPCFKNGNCRSLDSVLQVFAVIAQWLLGIAGSVMVLMFVWGGAEWVFSRGESGMVKSGKEKMTNAVIGIVLMFSALAIVRSIQVGLLGETSPSGATRCVVDSDCNSSQQCLAGECKARPAGQDGGDGALSCTFRDDCTANGTKPWMTCGIDNKCTPYCTSLKGTCKASCDANTEVDGGSGTFVCEQSSQRCCKPK